MATTATTATRTPSMELGFWQTSTAPYQSKFKVVDEPGHPTLSFPLVFVPSQQSAQVDAVIDAVRGLATKPSDGASPSGLRKLLDANGGAVNFRQLPLRTADDFSAFVKALAGSGNRAWVPHQDIGMQVLRKQHAEHVVTTNEGPPSHVISWHNEYAVSPSHPAYVVFFCLRPPTRGGETPITSSLAVFDRLQRRAPDFLRETVAKGLAYTVTHSGQQIDGTVGGNGVYKASAFGPQDGTDVSKLSEAEKRRGVEQRIRDLALLGGWRESFRTDASVPEWQRKGFTWAWADNGNVDVTSRVAGVRVHPSRGLGTFFNAMGTRYTNAKLHNTFEPPHTYTKEDGTEAVSLPPMFAGLDHDVPVPKAWLDQMNELQCSFAAEVKWETGDVLVIDNFACQHARWAWSGDRKILASFWDEPGLRAEAMGLQRWWEEGMGVGSSGRAVDAMA